MNKTIIAVIGIIITIGLGSLLLGSHFGFQAGLAEGKIMGCKITANAMSQGMIPKEIINTLCENISKE